MTARGRDLVVLTVLAVAAASLSWQTSRLTETAFSLAGGDRDRVWFGAEPTEFMRRLTAESVVHDRLGQHPLVSLLLRAPVSAIHVIRPAADPTAVVQAGLAVAAALWTVGLFVALRLIGCQRPDAVLFTTLGLVSAAATFWWGVPDLAAPSGLTILPALILVATGRDQAREWWTAGAVAASLSLRTALGPVGFLAALALHPRRRAIQVIVNGIGVVLILWGVQRTIFPDSGSLFSPTAADPGSTSVVAATTSLWLHSMVMPQVALTGPQLSVAAAWPGSGGVLGVAAVFCWIGLLGIGAFGTVTPALGRLRAFVLLALLAQWIGGVLAGGDAFCAAPDALSLLLVLASLGAMSRLRPVALGLAAALLVTATVNNRAQFAASFELAGQRPGLVTHDRR